MKETGTVNITDPFWTQYTDLIRQEMLPYQWRVLNDQEDIIIEKERDADYIPSQKSHAIENFKIAARESQGEHYGMVFQDSDVYKWLEAVAYALAQKKDEGLQALADSVVALIGKAQEEDGYLGTYFTTKAPERKFKRLYQSHELYCAGHFIEAAVAYFEAVHSSEALQIACRLADCLAEHFGTEENKIPGYDGHAEIELALFRLYEVTGEERYLKLGRFFIYMRGQDPQFFKKQTAADPDSSVMIEGMEGFRESYYQVHKPVLEQETAEGHAVRVVYLCTGMAKLAYLNQDEKILAACRRLWKNIVRQRMYITGAIGSTVIGEAFTADYDLPNDTMYGETCASIGLIFLAQNLLKNEICGEYADVMEQALYNTVLSGMALDGKHFFYVNPLEAVPELSRKDPGKSHVKVTRPAWFGCACCPPNLARLLTSLDRYMYSVRNNSIYTHLYLSAEGTFALAGGNVRLAQKTQYPWQGKIEITLQQVTGTSFGVALRIPGWAEDYRLLVNGEPQTAKAADGYVLLERIWEAGDQIVLDLPLKAVIWQAHPQVRADCQRVAVKRGPLVYCMEEKDNGDSLHLLKISEQAVFTEVWKNDLFGGIIELQTQGFREEKQGWNQALYQPWQPAKYQEQKITLIPYYCWANRGENEMLVWLYKK